MNRPEPTWSDDAFHVLMEAGVRQAAYVPDGGLSRLIDLCRAAEGVRAVPLTSEEEGVGLLAGAWLGGQRGVLMMQSSGVGNCVNMLSLTRSCAFPLLIIATMRGQAEEANPWQVPMGTIAADVLGLAGVAVHTAGTADAVAPALAAAARAAFDGPAAAAVLVAQCVVGVKTFEE